MSNPDGLHMEDCLAPCERYEGITRHRHIMGHKDVGNYRMSPKIDIRMNAIIMQRLMKINGINLD